MNDHIGSVAGKVWEYISEKGEVNLSSIPRALKEKAVYVNMGVGWLAREDKLTFSEKGDKILVSVK